ncbi:MAG: hypothetical protein IT227_05970 [Flavobacteriales bacterium]|jgi:hypothetical protein|nr:hypothetical protein [Flavobacteriales bacterium]
MSRVEIKQALIAKEVLNTTDSRAADRAGRWKNLPANVRRDVEESLAQVDRGETVSHAEAMELVRSYRAR